VSFLRYTACDSWYLLLGLAWAPQGKDFEGVLYKFLLIDRLSEHCLISIVYFD